VTHREDQKPRPYVDADDAPHRRARKDRRRWCRGKPGVAHTIEIRPCDPKWGYSVRVCGYPRYWRSPIWICVEQEFCTTCGKILRHSLDKDCTRKPGLDLTAENSQALAHTSGSTTQRDEESR